MKQRIHPTLPLDVVYTESPFCKWRVVDRIWFQVCTVDLDSQLESLWFVEEKREEPDTDDDWIDKERDTLVDGIKWDVVDNEYIRKVFTHTCKAIISRITK